MLIYTVNDEEWSIQYKMLPNFFDHGTFLLQKHLEELMFSGVFWVMLSRQLNTVKALSFMTTIQREDTYYIIEGYRYLGFILEEMVQMLKASGNHFI